MNYIKPEQIKAYVEQNPQGIAGMSEDLATMVNHFAQLIVGECVNIVDDAVLCREPASTYVGKIKQHFGVE